MLNTFYQIIKKKIAYLSIIFFKLSLATFKKNIYLIYYIKIKVCDFCATKKKGLT